MQKKIATALLALLSIPAIAETHRWVDASGEVHYSDQAPYGVAKDEKTLRAPAPSVQQAPSLAEKEAEFRKRRIEAEEARQKQEQDQNAARQQEKNCQVATHNLKGLQNGGRITRYDDKGERSYMDENDRAQRLAETQKSVDEWCNRKSAAAERVPEPRLRKSPEKAAHPR